MPKLLIVDDQPHIIRLMKRKLEKHGYTVETAANGELALQCVQAERPDFILTDIEMPLMDGCTFCEALHRAYGCNMPTVMIISGHYSHDINDWLKQFDGRVSFFEKPISLSRMIDALTQAQQP